MDETLNTGGGNWADWFQGVAGGLIGKAADAQFVRPYDIASMQFQALGQGGYYREGMPGVMNRPNSNAGITPGVLLLAGAAVVVVLLMKD